ncbi:MAG: hexulose-6-phosphate isomerase [Symploca sp. SIO3C6]|nr:hexulose-6-phosphate isomerase [Symploca sp. SIO3C6]NET05667.1 hexulose-6-phosphate isomerase [Symploca sp. SIO2B6]
MLEDEDHRTLQAIFEDPARSDIPWSKVKDLLESLGGLVKVHKDDTCVALGGEIAIFSRPRSRKRVRHHNLVNLRLLLRRSNCKDVD